MTNFPMRFDSAPPPRILVVIVLYLVASPIIALAAEDSFMDAGKRQAVERLRRENPDIRVQWGRFSGNPFTISGLRPIETQGDVARTLLRFIADNTALYGMDRVSDGMELAELSDAPTIYDCDPDAMEPLPALRDDEYYEPACWPGKLVALEQTIDGVPFLNGSVIAFLDRKDRIIALHGEYLGPVTVAAQAFLGADDALDSIADHLDLDAESISVFDAEFGYRFYSEVIPIWELKFHTPDGRTLIAAVNADSGDVVNVGSLVDNFTSEPDAYNAWLWGYTLDDEAAHVCNEPALRKRWVDTDYQFLVHQAAFNPDAHVYDLKENPNYPDPGNDLRIYPHGALSTWLGSQFMNDKCTANVAGPTCGGTVDDCNVATFTAFVHVLNAYNYVTSLRFDKNAGRNPNYSKLTVIVNKREEARFIERDDDGAFRQKHELSFGANSGFNVEGFPKCSHSGDEDAWSDDYVFNNYHFGFAAQSACRPRSYNPPYGEV